MKSRLMTTLTVRPKPITFLMLAVSFWPQYWLIKILQPMAAPLPIRLNRKKNWLAMPTAATSFSPTRPIIRVSTMLREEAKKFCTRMGRASTASVR